MPTTRDPRPATLFAPAKVNLYLKVIRRRPDGYHDIETLFERIAIRDVLTFRPIKADEIRLACTDRGLPAGPSNLVWKAAALLKERYGVKSGVAIRLEKNIPVAAGLGGGSSDAATTLLGLDRLWKLRLSKRRLLEHAAQLGSDVPFFILGVPFAVGKGRGERLRPLKARARIWHVLASPPLKVLTKDIYTGLEPSHFESGRTDGARLLSDCARPGKRPPKLFNTLERVILKRFPELERLKGDFLEAGAPAVVTSGSGPTVFAVVSSKAKGEKIARRLRRLHAFPFRLVSTDL